MDSDNSRRISMAEFDDAFRGRLGAKVSRYELRALWRRLDADGSGEVSLEELNQFLYRLEISTWPELTEPEIERCIKRMNEAAEKWHRCAGNWFKIFTCIDRENNGFLCFDELRHFVRGPLPGVSMSLHDLSEADLKGLWRAIDTAGDREVNRDKFMAFMKRHGARFSMHKMTEYSKRKRGLIERGRDIAAEVAVAPSLSNDRLRDISARLAQSLQSWLAKTQTRAMSITSPGIWGHLFEFVDTSGNGRLTLPELEVAVSETLRIGDRVSNDELKGLWKAVDANQSGEITAGEFGDAIYKLHLEAWPQLDSRAIARVVRLLNSAADKWHRAGGNWYKVLMLCDNNKSGNLDYEEVVDVVRKSFPGLDLRVDELGDKEIRGLWRAMDVDCSGSVSKQEFMLFMRNHGRAHSIHKLTEYSKAMRGLLSTTTVEMGPPASRTRDELRTIKHKVDKALMVFGAKHGMSSNRCTLVQFWERFFQEAKTDSAGRLNFAELERMLSRFCMTNRHTNSSAGHLDSFHALSSVSTAMSMSMSPATARGRDDSFVVEGVSHDDLYALWCAMDADGSGAVDSREWFRSLYRLEVEAWPVLEDKTLKLVISKINAAAHKLHRAGGNWYKVFRLVDADDSGLMDFHEFSDMVRRPYPCLSIKPSVISDHDLKGTWKALDADQSGQTTKREFMVFMRHHSDMSLWVPMVRPKRLVAVDQFGTEQAALLREGLAVQTVETLAEAYASWGRSWNGFISEWDWLQLVRELLGITEEQIDDDGLHKAWIAVDREGRGQVAVEDLLALSQRAAAAAASRPQTGEVGSKQLPVPQVSYTTRSAESQEHELLQDHRQQGLWAEVTYWRSAWWSSHLQPMNLKQMGEGSPPLSARGAGW